MDDEGPRLGKFVGLDQPRTLVTRTLQKAELSATRLEGSFVSGTPVRLDRNDGYLVCLQRRTLPTPDYWIDGKAIPIASLLGGQFLLLDLNQDHTSVSVGEVDCISTYIPRTALRRFHEEHDLNAVGSLRTPSGVTFDDPVIRHLGESLLPMFGHPEGASRLFVDHVLLAFLSHLAARYGERPAAVQPLRGTLAPWQERRAKEMLLANIDGDVRLDELAAACRLSRSHFARAFKATTGASAIQWLLARRIERAKTLLANSSLPVEQVAVQCGFADQSHLTRTFLKFSGVSPGRWRRLHRP